MVQYNDTVVQFNVSIPYFTNIPTDVIVNTWHLIYTGGGGADPAATNYEDVRDRLDTFYSSVYTSIAYGAWVQVANASLKAYRMWDAPPRVPAYSSAMPLAGTSGTGTTPTELALCLSYKAAPVSGVPLARQRGRIYLGGFSAPLAAGSASSFPELGSGQRAVIGSSASTFRTGVIADGWIWVVASPTQIGVGQETFDVTSGFVDNAADTQRRRGQTATARTNWP